MVSIRLNSFVLVLILLQYLTIAHTHQDMEKIQADLDNELELVGSRLVNDNKAMYEGVPVSGGVEKTRFKGRKMMLRQKIIKQGLINEEGKETSGAAHFVENCDHSYRGKGANLHVKCRLGSRRSHHHMKKKMVGFEAFNSDYNVPKSHPPRNN